MSDNHEHNGGHELENIDATSLLAQMIILFVVVLISVIAVAQWFYKQRDELVLERAKDGYAFAKEQRAIEDELLKGIDATTAAILKTPKKLRAAKPPAGWIHPDDLASGGAPAAGAAEGHSDALTGEDAQGDEAGGEATAAPGDKPADPVKADGAEPAKAADAAEPAKAADAAEPAKADAAKPAAKPDDAKNE
jgi:hypothetical protein